MVNQDLCGGHSHLRSSDDEISIKVIRNKQKVHWSYNPDIKNCQLVGMRQNKCVWAPCERVANAFEIHFVEPTDADIKPRAVDYWREQRLSNIVRQSRDCTDSDSPYGDMVHLIPQPEAGWKNSMHSFFWLLIAVIYGSLNSFKCYMTAFDSAQNIISMTSSVYVQWKTGKCLILYEKTPKQLPEV